MSVRMCDGPRGASHARVHIRGWRGSKRGMIGLLDGDGVPCRIAGNRRPWLERRGSLEPDPIKFKRHRPGAAMAPARGCNPVPHSSQHRLDARIRRTTPEVHIAGKWEGSSESIEGLQTCPKIRSHRPAIARGVERDLCQLLLDPAYGSPPGTTQCR